MRISTTLWAVAGALFVLPGSIEAQSTELAQYFGFTGAEITRIGEGAGPMLAADINGDGLNDIVVVNNHQSRLDILYQRQNPDPDDIVMPRGVNDLPDHWRFRRQKLTVAHRIGAVKVFDVDGDGYNDFIYAGAPAEIVILRQYEPEKFEQVFSYRLRGLAAGQDGMAVVDVMGDETPELCVLADGGITVFPLHLGAHPGLDDPLKLQTDGEIVAFFPEDYDGDGRTDLLAVIPEDELPLRLWLQQADEEGGFIGPELRFPMPALREAEPVRFPDRPASSLAVIERQSDRTVVYDLVTEPISGERNEQVQAEVFSFTDASARDRQVAVGDVNGDGLTDVLATDSAANGVAVYLQSPGRGLLPGKLFPSLKGLSGLALGQPRGDEPLDVAVLSREEKVVGTSRFTGGSLAFPASIPISTPGGEPVTMTLAELNGELSAVIIVKRKRDHFLEMHSLDDDSSEPVVIDLEGVNRSPATVLACDADQDGLTDMLLFTPNEPMTVVRADESGLPAQVLTEDDMRQFGLVSAADAENTALFDVDGDGREELLIAEDNFVRACRYNPETGWVVVEQVNAADPATKLVGVTVLDDGREQFIVAADKENSRLLLIGKEDQRWVVKRTLDLDGFRIGRIFAGSFSGDGEPNILSIGDKGFAVVRLAGTRHSRQEVADYRDEEENILDHEIEAGDVNGDGYVDLVVLDAGEQMLKILTFSAKRNLYYATGFKVFESRLFDGGKGREFEPSAAVISDVTGDGAEDITVLVHDRIIVYPQMTK